MSFSEQLTKSVENEDLRKFTELVNHPELLINDIFDSGLLHHLLHKYPKLPLGFFKVVAENINTDVNRIGKCKLPPILCTERSDIQDMFLELPKTNLDVLIDRESKMRLINVVLKAGDMELFRKLVNHPRTDLLQRGLSLNEDMTLLNYSMKNNMEAFRVLVADGTKIDPNRSGLHNAVHYAVKTKNFEAFRLLLARGANFNIIFRDRSVTLVEYLVEYAVLKISNVEMNHIKMLDLLLDEYFEEIAHKDTLFLKSISVDNVKIFNKFLDSGVAIDEKILKLLMDKPELLKIILSRIETIIIDQNVLANHIFNSENKELLDILANSQIVDNIRPFMIGYLFECESAELIIKIVDSNMEYLKRNNQIEHLLLGNDSIIINILLNAGEGAYLDTLLTSVPDIEIPSDFKQIGSVIYKEKYDLLSTLITKYNVCVTQHEHYKLLIDKGRLDLVLLALEVCSRHEPEALIYSIFVNNFYKLLPATFAIDLLLNEHISKNVISTNVFRELLKIDGFVELIEQHIDIVVRLSEEGKLRDLDWFFQHQDIIIIDVDTANMSLIFRLAHRGDEGISQLHRLFNVSSLDDRKRYIHDILRGVIAIGEIELFTKIITALNLENIELAIDKFLYVNPQFVMRNIDEILRVIPSLHLKYIGSLIVLMESNAELYESSEIARKLLAGEKYNPDENIKINNLNRELWRDDDGEADEDDEEDDEDDDWRDRRILREMAKKTHYTQLTELILNSNLAENTPKTPKGDAILALFKLCVETTNVNINARNSKTGTNNEMYTVLELCILKITRYSNEIDYTSPETNGYLQQIIQYLLSNEHIILNHHVNLIDVVTRVGENIDLGDLVTTIISNPTIDVNNLYIIYDACDKKNLSLLRLLLTIGSLDVNVLDADNKTPLHICIDVKFTEGALALLADTRIDISIVDDKGRNFARLANKAGMREVVEALSAIGQIDDKQIRVQRQIDEYEARMAAMGRVKQTRIRETLNSFDMILKEVKVDVEGIDETRDTSLLTPYSKSMCPFCLTYVEKESVYECVYLTGHTCPAELQNEALKRLYFGDDWATATFEICCICGRPGKNHGHYRIVSAEDDVSELLPVARFASHWNCNDKNGGGGREEMIARIVGILTEIKHRVDNDEHLVYGPELIHQLTMVANSSANDEDMISRAADILERKKWNANSRIEKFVKFNAPVANAAAAGNNARNVPEPAHEPIVYYDNTVNEEEDDKQQCMICLDTADNLFRPHESDAGYICDECIKRQVCASRYASVTCVLGCNPKKQIYKEDVNNLMDGEFCDGVAVGEAAANDD